MRRRTILCAVLAAAIGCQDGAAPGALDEAIQGGAPDDGDPAVGIVSTRGPSGPPNVECTAVLISPTVILTAGHCIPAADSGQVVDAFYTGPGAETRFIGVPANLTRHDISAARIYPGDVYHPGVYTAGGESTCPNMHEDLAVMQLAQPIYDIAPIPWQHTPAVFKGTHCTEVGYGDHSGVHSRKRSAQVTVFSNPDSASYTGGLPALVVWWDPNDLGDNGIADHGDSGGPLLCPTTSGTVIAGAVSCHLDGGDVGGGDPRAPGGTETYAPVFEVGGQGPSAWIQYYVTNGFADPASPMTRAEAAAAIVQLTGFAGAPPALNTFSDVFPTHPQYGPIEAVWREGLTSGTGVGGDGRRSYGPDSTVTRGQLAVFLSRAFGITQTFGWQSFADVPPSHLFYPFIQALATAGLAVPCPGQPGNFCPDAAATHGDAAAMLARFSAAGLRPPGGTTIGVTSATYGGNPNAHAPTGNATSSVAFLCNGSAFCDYAVWSTALGDPAPGVAKDFYVQYTCTPGGTVHQAWTAAEAGFGSVAHLRCP